MSAACSDHLFTSDFLTLMRVVDFQVFYWSNSIPLVSYFLILFVSSYLILFPYIYSIIMIFLHHNYLMSPFKCLHDPLPSFWVRQYLLLHQKHPSKFSMHFDNKLSELNRYGPWPQLT